MFKVFLQGFIRFVVGGEIEWRVDRVWLRFACFAAVRESVERSLCLAKRLNEPLPGHKKKCLISSAFGGLVLIN